MKNLIYTLTILLALCQTAYSQVKLDVTKVRAVTGAKQAQVYDNVILVDDAAELKVVNAAIIEAKTDAKFVQVKARLSLFESGTLIKASEKKWLLLGTTPGLYAVEATAFDPTTGISDDAVKVDLGITPTPGPNPPGPNPPPVPPPGPNPNPDCNNVPEDVFKNLGRRACGWAAGLTMRRELAGIYASAANDLRTNPALTINDVAQNIVTKREGLLGPNLVQYKAFVDNISVEIKTYWPMNKATMADFFQAISLGLANGQ